MSMYSLSDLEQNLKALIKELRGIEDSVAQPQRMRERNTRSMLIKVPRVILLAKICPYLTITEINVLSTVSSSLRKEIYGPIGFKILSRITSPYPIKTVNKDSDFTRKMKRVAMEVYDDPHEDYEDEKYIAQERTKFKKILLKKYSDYIKSKQKFQALREKVRVENSQIYRLQQQYKFHENIQIELNDQNKMHKDKLKSLSEGFSAKIAQIDQAIDVQMKEITKLQNQKEALAGKVREYQNDIQNIKVDSEKKKQILKRLKNYLLYKEL